MACYSVDGMVCDGLVEGSLGRLVYSVGHVYKMNTICDGMCKCK